jgi:phospholipid-binding lipoprotein MlaA
MRDKGPKRSGWAACVLAAALAIGFAGPARAQSDEANDPIEGFNRGVFEFNRGLDTYFLRPVAEGYRFIFPSPVRTGVRNLLNNVRTPVILANDLMQAEWRRAGETTQRFFINTLLGVGGIVDVAELSGHGPNFHNEDFGQTLGVWGSKEGPYLVLPVFGPAPPRDAIGLAGDVLLDPFTYYLPYKDAGWVGFIRFAVDGIDVRSRNIENLDEIERGAIDFYATIRSLYRQRRDDEIRNGRPAGLTRVPEIPLDTSSDDRPGRRAER